MPLILMSYRATSQASTGVTPNMMMLGRQTRLPVQAMYGTPMGPEEEETTVSEYVAALQGRLQVAYQHASERLQRAALHQKHDYDGKVQRCIEEGRASMDDSRAAWMCSCLKESRLRERAGTFGEEGTLPRGDRPVLRPRLNWEGGAALNDQNWYHAGSSELRP